MHAGMDQSDRFDDGESDFCEQRSVGLIEKACVMARQALGCGHLLTMLPEASKALSARERVLLFCERGWIGCDQGTPWCRCAPRAAPRDRGQTYLARPVRFLIMLSTASFCLVIDFIMYLVILLVVIQSGAGHHR